MITRLCRRRHPNRKEGALTPTKTFLSMNSRICPENLGLTGNPAKLPLQTITTSCFGTESISLDGMFLAKILARTDQPLAT
jgi:hypothetical protein